MQRFFILQANAIASSLEKKQKTFDKITDEWRAKCDAMVVEMENVQRDQRMAATETFKLRAALDEADEQVTHTHTHRLCL